MRPISQGRNGQVRLAQAARAFSTRDPVVGWQAAVLERVRQRDETRRPSLALEVSVGFVLFAAAIGGRGGVWGALETAGIAASVLLTHELARAAWARRYRRSARVSLSIFGAHTEISGPALEGRAALVFASIGALSNALVATLALLVARQLVVGEGSHGFYQLSVTHAYWGLAQLLPCPSFPAGRALARRLTPRGRRVQVVVSGFLLLILAVLGFGVTRMPAVLAVLGCATLAAVKEAREAYAALCDQRAGVGDSAAGARALLLHGDPRRAASAARKALERALSSGQRRALWTTLCWCGVADRDPFLAHTALLNLPVDAIDVHLLASYLSACNRTEEALALLRQARASGDRGTETSKLLIELLFARGDHAEARAVAESVASLLTSEDRRALEAVLHRSA